jgi:ATP-dependent RNA helicase RhlE
MTFAELQLVTPLLKALDEEGYTTPTPIQQQAIPLVLTQQDLLGTAQTGTGKTAAFSLPILQLLYNRRNAEKGRRQIKVLILTPTRELAIQIDESLAAYGRHTGITHAVIFGGVSQLHQTNQLKNGIDILTATPGRLLDLISQGFVSLQHLQIFVLDEADRMLDMGFIHDVKRIITKLPAQRQTLFFSATMPPEIQALADVLLTRPARVAVAPVSSTVDTIEQSLFFVDKANKPKLLLHLLRNKNIPTVLVFSRTKHGADKLVKILHKENVSAAAIHGNKSQNARQHALNQFKTGGIKVLVATDIAARGIDIDELTHVINFDLPEVPETYVHRIGRTGRAGNAGTAYSFCHTDEVDYLKQIQKLIAKKIPVNDGHPFPLSEAELAAPAPVPAAIAARKKPQRQWNSGRGNTTGRNTPKNKPGGQKKF